jgi:hypothetical protein
MFGEAYRPFLPSPAGLTRREDYWVKPGNDAEQASTKTLF